MHVSFIYYYHALTNSLMIYWYLQQIMTTNQVFRETVVADCQDHIHNAGMCHTMKPNQTMYQAGDHANTSN